MCLHEEKIRHLLLLSQFCFLDEFLRFKSQVVDLDHQLLQLFCFVPLEALFDVGGVFE